MPEQTNWLLQGKGCGALQHGTCSTVTTCAHSLGPLTPLLTPCGTLLCAHASGFFVDQSGPQLQQHANTRTSVDRDAIGGK